MKKQVTSYKLYKDVYKGTSKLFSKVIYKAVVNDNLAETFNVSANVMNIKNDNDLMPLFQVVFGLIANATAALSEMFGALFGSDFTDCIMNLGEFDFSELKVTHVLRSYTMRDGDMFVSRKSARIPKSGDYAVSIGDFKRTYKSGMRTVGKRIQYSIGGHDGVVDIAVNGKGCAYLKTWRAIAFYNQFVSEKLAHAAHSAADARSDRHTVGYDLVRGARGISETHTNNR